MEEIARPLGKGEVVSSILTGSTSISDILGRGCRCYRRTRHGGSRTTNGDADARSALPRMIDVGRGLRDRHGADVLVLACAGMARYRADLEEAVQIPVVEPTQAAVTMALGRVRLGSGRGAQKSPC